MLGFPTFGRNLLDCRLGCGSV